MIQNERGNFAEARAAYERLLGVNPNFGIALNNLAYLYSEQFGLMEKAYETARKARDLAPTILPQPTRSAGFFSSAAIIPGR